MCIRSVFKVYRDSIFNKYINYVTHYLKILFFKILSPQMVCSGPSDISKFLSNCSDVKAFSSITVFTLLSSTSWNRCISNVNFIFGKRNKSRDQISGIGRVRNHMYFCISSRNDSAELCWCIVIINVSSFRSSFFWMLFSNVLS